MLDTKKLLANILGKLINDSKVETRTYTSNGTVIVCKVGSVVTISFVGAISRSKKARTDIATLPAGWRPPQLVLSANISGMQGYGNVSGPDGKIQVWRGDRENEPSARVDTTLTYVATS